MKKLLFAVVLGLLLVAAVATVALADNGPHGGFNGSTEACASCHRAHSAQSSDGYLLAASDVYTLCTSCHDGTGAYTNVVDGFYDTSIGDPGKAAFPGGQGETDYGLFGGGFVNTRMLTDFGNASNEGGLATATTNAGADQNTSLYSWARWNKYDNSTTAIPTGRPVTSTHDVVTTDREGTVWGSGVFGSTNVVFSGTTELECTSCHDPHGNAGKQGGLSTGVPYPSYRLLRFQPSGSNGFEIASETGAGSSFAWNTSLTWNSASGLTGAVVPSALGVTVPDPLIKWYTYNSDIAVDPSVGAYRGRTAAGDYMVAVFAGVGDYMGRYYGYANPANLTTVATAGVDCPTIVTNPTNVAPPNAPDPAGSHLCSTGGTAFNNRPAHDALGYWCATCHDRYLALGGNTAQDPASPPANGSGSRVNDTGDPAYHFRHTSEFVSSFTRFGTGVYDCVDCHNAHGTSSTANALAQSATYADDSALLKADNRAVCVRCHAPSVNFFNVTTSPNAPWVAVP
jgi:predicted CXXCH cytochrome family protein